MVRGRIRTSRLAPYRCLFDYKYTHNLLIMIFNCFLFITSIYKLHNHKKDSDSNINVEDATTFQPTGLCLIRTYIRLFHVIHIAVSNHHSQLPSYLSSFNHTIRLATDPYDISICYQSRIRTNDLPLHAGALPTEL